LFVEAMVASTATSSFPVIPDKYGNANSSKAT
jgi:hypothetical protein